MTIRTTSTTPQLTHEANPVHRDSSRKSHHTQWAHSVTEYDEFRIFEHSVANGWGDIANSFWGIRLLANGELETLNEPILNGGRKAKWCRFIGNTQPQIWHGYPTLPDPTRECPPQETMLLWAAHKPLTAAKVMKILRGRQCNF